jgi:hypothetical protein
MGSTPLRNPTRIVIDASVLFAAALSEAGFARDLILAGARLRAVSRIDPTAQHQTP